MAQENRHMTIEQLSAFLDGEVSAQEQTQWENHLKSCSHCQQELASLRQTVAMLHALPSPVLPRSFVLPLETPKPSASPIASTPIPIETARNQQRKSYVRVVMRTISTIAAVIGIVFLLSALLPTAMLLQRGGTSATSTGSSVASSNAPSSGNTEPRAQVSVVAGIATSEAEGTPTFAAVTPPIPPVTRLQPAQSTKLPSNAQQPAPSSWLGIFNLGAPTARLGVGMLLIIFGIMGIVLFKRQPQPARE